MLIKAPNMLPSCAEGDATTVIAKIPGKNLLSTYLNSRLDPRLAFQIHLNFWSL